MGSAIVDEPQMSPSVAPSLTLSEPSSDEEEPQPQPPAPRHRRASTALISQRSADVQRITGETASELAQRCCGGGCCKLGPRPEGTEYEKPVLPDNDAFRSLKLSITGMPKTPRNTVDFPEQIAFLLPLPKSSSLPSSSALSGDQAATRPAATADYIEQSLSELGLEEFDTTKEPPSFVQPHPPFHVFPARIHSTRELTKPGAQKRTFHYDLDITDYPDQEDKDFVVGGAIGVTPANAQEAVDEILDLLLVPRYIRDKPVLLRTTKGRWPTVWGDDVARDLVTTRRALLTWCCDIQSFPPNKPLLRVLAEYATDECERKALLFLCSAEGQGPFCDMRTGPHISLLQLLHAFPSATPPLDMLMSVLPTLMPRFYSLSADPYHSGGGQEPGMRRTVEIAVTVHETTDWRTGTRTGTASGFLQRQSLRYLEAQKNSEAGGSAAPPDLYIPMFKGLMANPLAKQFMSDGPMLLIGAGVGIAPFRGFVQARLKSANCANKVWVLQGIRDSLVDELYSGEWGDEESKVKRVVESQRGEGRYVQEEVCHQADLVWSIINSVDGRIFVCGSSAGMGEGVERALVDVAMAKGNLKRDEAQEFWGLKREVGQYITETW